MLRHARVLMVAVVGLVSAMAVTSPAAAQYGLFDKAAMLKYTALYTGERFPDGRPKVPDSVLDMLRGATLEDIIAPLRKAGEKTMNTNNRWKHGYIHQFDVVGWRVLHPQRSMVGRAVTASFMPGRADIQNIIEADGRAAGLTEPPNTWPIRTLVKGDVLVVDLFGKIDEGTIIGDGLGTTIASQIGPGGGIVVDGAVRDADGLFPIPDFNVYARDYHHTALQDVMLMGLNVPVRIGEATCMPGDVVVGTMEGVVFIPAHVAEEVALAVELMTLRTLWRNERIQEGKYTYTQSHTKTGPIQEDFEQWLQAYRAKRQ